MKYVWSDWPTLNKRIRAAKRRLLILDFDGTLTRIAKTPQEVIFEKRTQDLLQRLSRNPSYRLAIISGRSLKNLMSFFHIKEAFYAGNHGLELRGGKLLLPEKAKAAKKFKALVWLLAEKMRAVFSGLPGVLIEDKGFTLSLHHRNILRGDEPSFKQKMARFKKQHAHWPIIWKKGKKVWEARPGVKWGKGNMALYLSKRFSRALPIVIGDDVTDEDMFKSLRRRAITVRVGHSRRSSAAYYLRSPREVADFLEVLADL